METAKHELDKGKQVRKTLFKILPPKGEEARIQSEHNSSWNIGLKKFSKLDWRGHRTFLFENWLYSEEK